jgi:hypothetical protein
MSTILGTAAFDPCLLGGLYSIFTQFSLIGASPSGKASVFGTDILGSIPSAPAI